MSGLAASTGSLAGAGLAGCRSAAAVIGRAATVALYEELQLYPKPGLVSFVDEGSHTDMDATTFMRSLFALRRYFPQMAGLGAQSAEFAALEAAGIAAERQMLSATAGVNTHRGAVFSLGLLCAAAGRCAALGLGWQPANLRASLRQGWGQALTSRCLAHRPSKGQTAARLHGLRPAGEEAALGMPVLFEVAVPALQQALDSGLGPQLARLQTLFHIMAVLEDTNLAHRGGLAGLRFGQRAAAGFLAAGGAARSDAVCHAEAIHRDFVVRHLSPGGSADALAAACWVIKLSRRS
jgi:triphosphoribosyl-dephospho-CoA synthase